MNTVVRMDGVFKDFGAQQALRGMDLNVPEGGAYALIGANGAGKTTTFKLLMNILQPSSGTASVMGVDSRRLNPALLAQIGYVSENQRLPPRMQVGEYLRYLRPFYPTWDLELEASICRRLELPLERRISELSHGMRIKAALACALPFRPKLLLLDEPFSGLDALVRDEFMEGLLMQAGDTTLLISSQELAEIESLTTHVGFLHGGRLLFEESMDTLGARMREIRAVFDGPVTLPAAWPKEWLQPRTFGNVLSFIDSRYSEASLAARLAALVGTARQLDATPLSLRNVFTSLARAARDGGLP